MKFNSYNKFVYKQYLESPHWKNLEKKALEKAEFKCEKCGSENNIKCQHKNFNNLYRETLNDIIVLCDKCKNKSI